MLKSNATHPMSSLMKHLIGALSALHLEQELADQGCPIEFVTYIRYSNKGEPYEQGPPFSVWEATLNLHAKFFPTFSAIRGVAQALFTARTLEMTGAE